MYSDANRTQWRGLEEFRGWEEVFSSGHTLGELEPYPGASHHACRWAINSRGQRAALLCCTHKPCGHCLGSNSTFWKHRTGPTQPQVLQSQNKPSSRVDYSYDILPETMIFCPQKLCIPRGCALPRLFADHVSL